jgi:hypothetical protein
MVSNLVQVEYVEEIRPDLHRVRWSGDLYKAKRTTGMVSTPMFAMVLDSTV